MKKVSNFSPDIVALAHGVKSHRVDVAFFTLNGWVGVALFVGMALDMALLGTGGSLA